VEILVRVDIGRDPMRSDPEETPVRSEVGCEFVTPTVMGLDGADVCIKSASRPEL
jgi:hypothetical protein